MNARLLIAIALVGVPLAAGAAEPLPSWSNSDARQAITAFVEKTTSEGGADFVPPDERIAVFDNDGTLWSE
jgi:hypothetical protein